MSYFKAEMHQTLTSFDVITIGMIFTKKIGEGLGVHDVIIHSNFIFNIFGGFRSTGGQNFRFPINFAGHRYNSAAVIRRSL